MNHVCHESRQANIYTSSVIHALGKETLSSVDYRVPVHQGDERLVRTEYVEFGGGLTMRVWMTGRKNRRRKEQLAAAF